MSRWLALLLLLVAACSKGPKTDLPTIGQARSLAAEWALVNEQADKGHLTSAYTRTMRASVRDQLQSSLKSLTEPKSQYGSEIEALLREPGDASPRELRAHAGRLMKAEKLLESA
jgi:hypothetical protein